MVVHQAFDRLDKQGANMIEPHVLISNYDAARHPDVQMGRRSEGEVMKELLDTFDVGGAQPGMVTREEFVEYYSNIAAATSDNDFMEMVIRRTWHVGDAMHSSMPTDQFNGIGSKARSGVSSRIKDARSFTESSILGNTQPAVRPNSATAGFRRPSAATAIQKPSGVVIETFSQSIAKSMTTPSRPKSAGSVGGGARRGIFQQEISTIRAEGEEHPFGERPYFITSAVCNTD